MLVIELDSILIDNVKIHTNIHRFNRLENEFKGGYLWSIIRINQKQPVRTTLGFDGNLASKVGERSFMEVVNNGLKLFCFSFLKTSCPSEVSI